MRRGLGLVWALVTLAVVGAVGWLAYGAGVAQGASTAGQNGPATNPAVYPYYVHTWGFGFGFFPLFLFILLLFFLFRRPWGYRHWGGGYGRHGGYGGPTPGSSELPPPLEERMQAWHSRAHGDTPPAPGADDAGLKSQG